MGKLSQDPSKAKYPQADYDGLRQDGDGAESFRPQPDDSKPAHPQFGDAFDGAPLGGTSANLSGAGKRYDNNRDFFDSSKDAL
jgi:hypothetical protein